MTDDIKPRTVVRVKTERYATNNGVAFKKTVNTLKRKSYGYNLITESVKDSDAELTVDSIINLLDVPDGIYEVVMTNLSHDWETGYLDDWDLKLVPYTDELKDIEPEIQFKLF